MKRAIPCGDCGAMLPPGARGCEPCGRNVAAERKVVTAVLLAAAAAACLLAYVLVSLSGA
jgi:hypothetical protein